MLSLKFIKKYLRLAKTIGEDNNSCYSRGLGVVVVDPVKNTLISTGYNGPPKDTPHCGTADYIKNVVKNVTSDEEYNFICNTYKEKTNLSIESGGLTDCLLCPRRILNIPSGCRMELCSCAHAEVNAILNDNLNVSGAWMFGWFGLPCFECSKVLINKKIAKFIGIEMEMKYNTKNSLWLLQQGKHKVDVELYPESILDNIP